MTSRRLGLLLAVGFSVAAVATAVACGGDDEAPARERSDAATDSTPPGTDPNNVTDGAVDAGPDARPAPVSTVKVTFERGVTPVTVDAGDGGDGGISVTPIVVVIDAREASGAPVPIANVEVAATGGTISGELQLPCCCATGDRRPPQISQELRSS
ncbi:MAG: hypothetical protein U0235_21125 [Polyangiaceae bacterium]